MLSRFLLWKVWQQVSTPRLFVGVPAGRREREGTVTDMDKKPDLAIKFLAIKFNDVINRYLVKQINKLAHYLDSGQQQSA
jgi:hypothetical protein